MKSQGKARKVRISHVDTFISGPEGVSEEIQNRINEIKFLISQTSNPPSLMILKVNYQMNK